MNHKILLVEDDIEISEMLKNYLTLENYEVICAADGQEACNYFDRTEFSLILLDLMIPKISGIDVMQHIRKNSVVPIIIVSAKDTETDKTLGLNLGADDYITKPFSVAEVLARIKANIRRRTQYDQSVMDPPQILTLGKPKKVYTKEQIYSLVWNDAYLGDENAVNVHISRLRNKIEEDTRNPKYIITVWGIGYKLGEAL